MIFLVFSSGAHEKFRVLDVTLENMWVKLQIPPLGPFDRIDISWKRKLTKDMIRARIHTES